MASRSRPLVYADVVGLMPRVMERLPRSAALRVALARVGLPAWFLAIDVLWIVKPWTVGIDARHYQRAATEWLAGGNPWAVTESGIAYAAGPHTLLLYAPTSLFPVQVSTVVWMALGIVAAVWVVKRLGLPIWWAAFPPLAHAVWNGNPQVIVVALLVVSTVWASALAVVLKLYAGLPLLFRPRQLVVAVVVLAVTLPFVPWQLYVDVGLGISSHLTTAWNGSAWRVPLIVPPTLLALWLLRQRGAEWYIVPALFPATQFYYVSTVLPAVASRPLLAAATALPVPLLVPAIVILLAAEPRLRAALARPGARRLIPRITRS